MMQKVLMAYILVNLFKNAEKTQNFNDNLNIIQIVEEKECSNDENETNQNDHAFMEENEEGI